MFCAAFIRAPFLHREGLFALRKQTRLAKFLLKKLPLWQSFSAVHHADTSDPPPPMAADVLEVPVPNLRTGCCQCPFFRPPHAHSRPGEAAQRVAVVLAGGRYGWCLGGWPARSGNGLSGASPLDADRPSNRSAGHSF